MGRRCISASLRRYPWVFTVGELLIPLLLPNCGEENFPWAQLLQLLQITAQSVGWSLLGWGRSFYSVLRSPQEWSCLWLVPGATSALPLHWEDPQEPEDCPFFPELAPNRHKWKGPDLPFKSVEAQMYLFARLPGSFHIAHVVSRCCCFITLKYCCALVSPLLLSWDFSRTAAFGCTLIGCWVPQKSFW